MGVNELLGLIINEKEQKELEYLLRREMDELLYDFNYHGIDPEVRLAIKDRYATLFNLYKRFASHSDCLHYTPTKYFANLKRK